MRPRYELTVLFCFYLLQLFVPVRTPIKTKCGDKQWKPCHLILARAFIFHFIKCFHQWSSTHSFNSVNHNPDHIALGKEKTKLCIAYIIEKERERERGEREEEREREREKKEMFPHHPVPLTLRNRSTVFCIILQDGHHA